MYTVKVKNFPFDKKYTCKGHEMIKETGTVVLYLSDERRIYIPPSKTIEFSRELFDEIAAKVLADSQGKADMRSK